MAISFSLLDWVTTFTAVRCDEGYRSNRHSLARLPDEWSSPAPVEVRSCFVSKCEGFQNEDARRCTALLRVICFS
jgi:hypothetical protein